LFACNSESIDDRYERFTKNDLLQIELALRTFERFHGRYPSSTEGLYSLKYKDWLSKRDQKIWTGPYANFLRSGNHGEVIDLWGNRIEYKENEAGMITITSRGVDGVLGTADDIQHSFFHVDTQKSPSNLTK
jgi:hypothetical protein